MSDGSGRGEPVLEVRGLKRSFEQAGVRIDVLRGIDLSVREGELVVVYPEATISRSFELKEFKSGAARMALEALAEA